MNIRTQVIHGGHQVDPRTGAVNMPIYQTTTFKQTELGGGAKWEYIRSENPTRASLLSAAIKHLQMSIGATLGASDSYLVLRSLKTFALCMRAHNDNAQALFNWLQMQSQVAKIYYPGDASSAQYAIAQKQMQGGFGGMISVELQAGLDVKKFVESLKIFTLAESLGGVESLVEVPAVMTHAAIPADIRHEHGITDELIRISVGIEDSQDLIADFQQGLAQL
ncbi:PLP-dependent transferase [Leuconostoc falkenbergense]|uniref:PLP-dependent transferase n=1 Tax=Leuconostoc falkenbergense TaxID=2766470 RepID=UPI0024A98778|nr:PLP-dependent transferase [Leuconostoc falkenbergense]MDI6553950.1 PLP-dependent transferase [Leuconostoc falkenbergense]